MSFRFLLIDINYIDQNNKFKKYNHSKGKKSQIFGLKNFLNQRKQSLKKFFNRNTPKCQEII